MLMNRPPKIPYIPGLEVTELHGRHGWSAFEFAQDQQNLQTRRFIEPSPEPDMWAHHELPPEIEARITELTYS